MTDKIEIKVKKSGNISKEERKLRQEASRLVSLANKRIKRIEQQGLTESPAYKKFVEDGKQKFGYRDWETIR